MPHITTLGEQILYEMRARDMSAREFADFVGVSHSSINKFLNHGVNETYNGRPVGDPSIDFLVKLSRATGVDISSLILLVAPPDTSQVDAMARLLAERIAQLPPEDQAFLDRIIMGFAAQNIRDAEDAGELRDGEHGDS